MPPQVNLQPGSTNKEAVKQLQNWLVSNGYMTQAQVNTGYGTYGPQTTAAVTKAQQATGVDNSSGPGYWGPRTISAVSQNISQPTSSNTNSYQQPQNQAELDAAIKAQNAAVVQHPTFAGNSQEDLNYAASTGDFARLLNTQGQPFSDADQAQAVSEATAALDPYYKAQELKNTQDTEAALAEKKREYNDFLATQGDKFQADKTNLDQSAADRGVLFSGGRVQKEKSLQDTYTRANENKLTSTGADIANTARNFGYNYGDSAANNLSQYYNLGKNTYNANTAVGGVGSGSLSSIYNVNQGFQGTQKNTAKSAIQSRAAGLLANKGNKLLSTGYTNQF